MSTTAALGRRRTGALGVHGVGLQVRKAGGGSACPGAAGTTADRRAIRVPVTVARRGGQGAPAATHSPLLTCDDASRSKPRGPPETPS